MGLLSKLCGKDKNQLFLWRIMKVGIPREIVTGERRVALVPDSVATLVQSGFEVLVEASAGSDANYPDESYISAGASIANGPESLYSSVGLILKVQGPSMNDNLGKHEVDLMVENSVVIAAFQPLSNLDLVKLLIGKGITCLSMDAIPRIARAQKMDSLSSMSSLSGYKSVLIASNSLGKYFPMLMTAAATVPPARGFILGAGVAGLQAIATARRLGAVVRAFDVRPDVKQQVESLGATFIQVEEMAASSEDTGGYAKELSEDHQRLEQEVIHEYVKDSDFVITTALIPGRPAPLLITEAMVNDMKPGSVIVDIAAETGGNCALTKPGEVVTINGVEIHGPVNLPSSMPQQASHLYSRNIVGLLQLATKEGELNLDFDDAIINGCCITHESKVVHGPTKERIEANS